jgi:sulfur-oxidizing protein SoxY
MRTDHDARSAAPTARFLAAACAGLLLLAPAAAAEDDVWAELKGDLFGDRAIQDGAAWLALEAPYRAHDAALVPIDIVAPDPALARRIRTITLVIDKNPAPVAAVVHLEPGAGVTALSTRVRVNAYSHVRAIAEADDGGLYMVARFVKASGGCSAPAAKDQDAAMASLGKMRLRQFTPIPGSDGDAAGAREVQLMIRHPNNSGLQMDQLTRNYIPAHFVQTIDIRQGPSRVLSVEGAISLSEDPSLRFRFRPDGSGSLSARAEDTEGGVFEKTWSIGPVPVAGGALPD